jgi:hypothetical protein
MVTGGVAECRTHAEACDGYYTEMVIGETGTIITAPDTTRIWVEDHEEDHPYYVEFDDAPALGGIFNATELEPVDG